MRAVYSTVALAHAAVVWPDRAADFLLALRRARPVTQLASYSLQPAGSPPAAGRRPPARARRLRARRPSTGRPPPGPPPGA